MDSKLFLCLNLIFSSWVFVGFSQIPAGLLEGSGIMSSAVASGSGSGSGSGGSLPCVQKLLPCQPYLTNPSSPPSSCCVPLKDMITDQPQCLCDIFNNPDILKSLSVSQDDGLKLLKACGANADVSVCNKSGGSNSTAPTPSATADADASNGSSIASSPSSGNSTNTTTKSTATKISLFGGFGFIAIIMSLFV